MRGRRNSTKKREWGGEEGKGGRGGERETGRRGEEAKVLGFSREREKKTEHEGKG